jgi:hypothetical protein
MGLSDCCSEQKQLFSQVSACAWSICPAARRSTSVDLYETSSYLARKIVFAWRGRLSCTLKTFILDPRYWHCGELCVRWIDVPALFPYVQMKQGASEPGPPLNRITNLLHSSPLPRQGISAKTTTFSTLLGGKYSGVLSFETSGSWPSPSRRPTWIHEKEWSLASGFFILSSISVLLLWAKVASKWHILGIGTKTTCGTAIKQTINRYPRELLISVVLLSFRRTRRIFFYWN